MTTENENAVPMTTDNENDDGPRPNNDNPPRVNNKRRRWSIQEKMTLVRCITRRIEVDGMSVRKGCESVNVHHKQYLNWKKELHGMGQARNPKGKSNCVGRSSILKPIQEDLLKFIFELRKQRIWALQQIWCCWKLFLCQEISATNHKLLNKIL